MSCVLRVYGKDFEVDRFIACLPEGKYHFNIARKGDHRFKNRPEKGVLEYSVASTAASDANMDSFAQQKEDVISFLQNNEELFTLLSNFDIAGKCMNFGVFSRFPNGFCHSDYFSPELVALCGKYNLGIELSQYIPADEEEMEPAGQ